MVHSLDLEEFRQVLRGRIGLIVGPCQTLNPIWQTAIAAQFKSSFGIEGPGSYLDWGAAAIAKGHNALEVRNAVKLGVTSQQPSPILSTLATVRWSSVLSCSLDMNLEMRLQEQADSRPGRRSITVLSDLKMAIPPRDVPAFKMLGSVQRDDFPVTPTQYLLQKNNWRRAVPAFADRVHGDPVLCLGMSGLETILLELLSEMVADRNSAPHSLIMLADDPLSTNHELSEILAGRSTVSIFKGTVTDLVKVLTAAEKENFQRLLPLTRHSDNPYAAFQRFSDFGIVVNQHLESQYKQHEKLILLDLLFSPATTNFDPFVHNLDFRRTLESELVNHVVELSAKHENKGAAIAVIGTSATGKTILLKRVALQLAQKGNLTIWLKPCLFPDPLRYCRKFFEELGRVARATSSTVTIILDDAASSGSLPPALIHDVANDIQLPIVLVFGIRTVDWESVDKAWLIGDSLAYEQIDLADDFDDAEWGRLPDYLASLGVEPSADAARKKLATIGPTLVKDTLSVLYWLLPQTRHSIEASIRSEFLNLGDPNIIRKVVSGSKQHSPMVMRDAYGMVAVADKYRVPLPIEVLVAALEIDYGTWLNAAKSDGPIWGILYSVDSEVDDGEYYRTRNSLITDMLVGTINGGTTQRSGEVGVLTTLIQACHDKVSPVYREFCVRLLIPGKRLEGLEYSQGLQLYNSAIASLSHPDQTLVHHKGLWIKNVGRDPLAAIEVFEEALRTPPYPYTDRPEAEEHIHTSIAAAWLTAMKMGLVARDEGKDYVIDNIARARAADFFNPHAVHVNARHSASLIETMGVDKPVDVCSVAAATLVDIDNALNVLQSPIDHVARDAERIHALEQVRDEVLGVASDSIQSIEAPEDIFVKFKSQLGFVLQARKLLAVAEQSGKGTHFSKAFNYVLESRALIERSNAQIELALLEIQLQIYYRWKITRCMLNSAVGHIDWVLMNQLAEEAIRHARSKGDVFFRFLHALSLAHLNDWANSQLEFTQIRQCGLANQVLWRPRALLINEQGGARSVQGIIRYGAGKTMLYSEELQADVPCNRKGNWPREGEVAHAWIEFAFAGGQAIEAS